MTGSLTDFGATTSLNLCGIENGCAHSDCEANCGCVTVAGQRNHRRSVPRPLLEFVGDAIIFFDTVLSEDFVYRCKQAGQLASKMRFFFCLLGGTAIERSVAGRCTAQQCLRKETSDRGG